MIPGTDYAEEIASVVLARKDLDDFADDYDERYAELSAELRRLRALPVQPEVRTAVKTGRTEGDAFRVMSPEERRSFVRLWTLTVWPAGHDALISITGNRRRWVLTR